MVTTVTRETESNVVVASPVVEPAAALVDISAIPESPAELLEQWDTPRRPQIHTVIVATLGRIWDAVTGPGMTDQDRNNRNIAEHNGYHRTVGRNL